MICDFLTIEEVVESSESSNPNKYRAEQEPEEEEEDQDEEQFRFLEAKEFVESYKQSEYYQTVLSTVKENSAPQPKGTVSCIPESSSE